MTGNRSRRRRSCLVEPSGDLRPAFQSAGSASDDPLADALERGRREGVAQVLTESNARIEKMLDESRQSVVEALEGFIELRRDLVEEARREVVELALEAASRMLRDRIDAEDPIAARALQQALDAIPGVTGIVARVHPDDLDPIIERLGEQVDQRRLELRPDESIHRGGCVLESESGNIDGRVETAERQARFAALESEA